MIDWRHLPNVTLDELPRTTEVNHLPIRRRDKGAIKPSLDPVILKMSIVIVARIPVKTLRKLRTDMPSLFPRCVQFDRDSQFCEMPDGLSPDECSVPVYVATGTMMRA